MRYNVIAAKNFNMLVEEVNKAIAAGWELQGGISTCSDTPLMTTYYQSIIKR